MSGGAFPAEVVGTDLVDVEGEQVHFRVMEFAVPAIAVEEAVDDVLGVGVFEEDGADGCEFGACAHGLRG